MSYPPTTLPWDMSLPEKLGLYYLLSLHKGEAGLEVGTFKGGSLEAEAHYLRHVTSLYIVPDHHEALKGTFPNVTLIAGPSAQTLPTQLKELAPALGFLLIDGAHEYHGAAKDFSQLTTIVPQKKMHVVCHDSFNPEVRLALHRTAWHTNPYIHSVDLDYIQGSLLQRGSRLGQMWGGFAVIHLKPEVRKHALHVVAKRRLSFWITCLVTLPIQLACSIRTALGAWKRNRAA